jgi:predicted RND superfamily exporter protein
VLNSFLDSIALSVVLVLLILLFLTYALGQGNAFAILLSSIWGPMMLLSAFVIFKIPISYITSVFVSLLVGLAGDNAIHYLFANSRQGSAKAYKDLGGASILMTFCMIIACTTLFVSIFAPMKTLGLLLIIGFILTVLGDFWILQALETVHFKWPGRLKKPASV